VPVVLLSLAAALAFAVAAVLQQHAAAAQPPEHNLRPILVLKLVQRPLWLAGIAASVIGTVLQLLALWHGSLVTVQPLLVCGLLFALPINAIWMHRRRPGARELLAAVTVCLGLVILLLSTDPHRGSGTSSAKGWAIALGSVFVAVVVLVACSLVSKRATWQAGLLATAGGVINGLSAAFIKGVARGMEAGWERGFGSAVTRTLSNWELYAFAATLLLVVLLVQSAFQSGPIRWSLPALTAANPVASVLLGATLLGEHIRSSPLALAGAGAGLLLVVGGIMALSSSSLITGGAVEPEAASVLPASPTTGPIVSVAAAVGLVSPPTASSPARSLSEPVAVTATITPRATSPEFLGGRPPVLD
jgi:drug/metabolite transporter (DMT)-like permease